uniref:Uncharacterized protein n=1 Tax=Rhizophora mucronata TaxID=61149 RepID=A0A2P2IW74_RHIMU
MAVDCKINRTQLY